jgi:glyoxylase-like metal-dependent hydrolase (beta-lactamase superfamily II)
VSIINKEPASNAGFFVLNPEPGIITVDTHHIRPRLDASHFIIDHGRVAIVDTGTALSVPYLLRALEELRLSPQAVDWVLLTHIHLDHAGGAGSLLQYLPNAKVAVHPRGARHLVDPSRLVSATIDVYGEAFFRKMYGEVVPISQTRIVATVTNAEIFLGQRRLTVHHTPGHALHHQVFYDHEAHCVMAGDAFGVSYRDFDKEDQIFIMPATTPSQLDPKAMVESINSIVAMQPVAVYLTHYSRLGNVVSAATSLKNTLEKYVTCALDIQKAKADKDSLKKGIELITLADLNAIDDQRSDQERLEFLSLDIELNVQGLWHWLSQAST